MAASPPFHVLERDIDLLLLEQLHLAPSFVAWFAARVGIPEAHFEEATHSVHAAGGETDVLLMVTSPAGRTAVMIEDKIGAAMQPRQAERYHERCKALCASGAADGYVTVLCAPSAYLASLSQAEPRDHRLPLEELAAWLEPDPSPAASWRRAILHSAASRLSRARAADDRSNHAYDAQLVALKSAYVELIASRYPSLLAREQMGAERELYIRARSLPTGLRFKHSFFRGEVSLILERKWAEPTREWLTAHRPGGSSLVQYGGELHLRIPTEVMDPAVPLPQQDQTAVQALDTITRLMPLAEQIAQQGA